MQELLTDTTALWEKHERLIRYVAKRYASRGTFPCSPGGVIYR
ncbi:hypothetical protein FACS1894219_10650 [Clostridia bacterium]|nr:hypothetical protein FACS1894219_10650 [Clostridia bacterium]